MARHRWLNAGVAILSTWLFFQPAVQASPRSQALYARGLVPFNAGQWDQALQLFGEAVQADSRDAVAVYYRGLTRARRGELEAAIADIRQALSIDPALPHAHLDLGIAQISAGNNADARDSLEQAYKQGNERTTAAFFLGLSHYRLADYDAAVRLFKEAEVDPELRAAAHYYAGLALTKQGKDSAARDALEQTAREFPQSEIGTAAQQYVAGQGRGPAVAAASGRPWQIWGGLGFEYDSNVSASPSDSSLTLEDGDKSDGRAVLRAGGGYKLLDTSSWRLDTSYDFSQSLHFSENDFDQQGHLLRGSFQSKPGQLTYGVVGAYNFFLLDFESFYQEGLGTPWVTVAETDWTATQGYYTIRGRDFLLDPYDPGRDAINHAFGLRQHFTLGSPDRRLAVSYQYDIEDTISDGPMGEDFAYKGNQLDMQVVLPFGELGVFQSGYTYRKDNYDNPNRGVGPKRDDDIHRVAVSFMHPISDYLSASLGYIGIFDDSNIQDFDYDRHIVSGAVQLTY